MRSASALAAFILSFGITTAPASPAAGGPTVDAETDRYVGAHAKLMNSGLAGASELGFGAAMAPHRNLELELAGVRHSIDNNPFIDDPAPKDQWLVQGMVRAKLPARRWMVFAGGGLLSGRHARSTGGYCTSSGLINLCGNQRDTRAFASWNRLWMARIELGAEARLGPFALRTGIGPAIPLNRPDLSEGLDPEDGATVIFDASLRARFSL